jgi:hypothetical protein
MQEDESIRAVAFIIEKRDDGWFVALPDKTLLGPYRNGELALEVAVAHALLARNRGVEAQIYVQDDHGGHHSCMILDHMNDPHRCAKCEASWSSSELPVKCPLRAAIAGG